VSPQGDARVPRRVTDFRHATGNPPKPRAWLRHTPYCRAEHGRQTTGGRLKT